MILFQPPHIMDMHPGRKGRCQLQRLFHRPIPDPGLPLAVPNVIPRAQRRRRKTLAQKGQFRRIREGFQPGQILKGQDNPRRFKVWQERIQREGERIYPLPGNRLTQVAFLINQRPIHLSAGRTKDCRQPRPIRLTAKEKSRCTQFDATTMCDHHLRPKPRRTLQRSPHRRNRRRTFFAIWCREAIDLGSQLRHADRHRRKRMQTRHAQPLRHTGAFPRIQIHITREITQLHLREA